MVEQTKPVKHMDKTQYTLCVPSTCISRSNAANLEQVTHVAYQIAKAATVYNVGEVVVLNVVPAEEDEGEVAIGNKKVFLETDAPKTDVTPESMLLALLLQFFVTPPYLRKSVFQKKHQKSFEYAKKLPKLSTLPFMQNNRVYDAYREGITVAKKSPKLKRKTDSGKTKNPKKLSVTKYVNIGTAELLVLEGKEVPVNVRVTVDVKQRQIVSPTEAYGVIGAHSSFGYHVRIAKTFGAVFTECAYPEGYSKSVYVNSGDYFGNSQPEGLPSIKEAKDGKVLVVVSKWRDVEESFKRAALEGIDKCSEMFDGELAVPRGSKVEDGCLIALSKLI